MMLFPPPSSKDVFFSSPSSFPDFLGGVHCPLCPLSLSPPLLFSLSHIHRAQKGEEEGEREVFHLGQEGHGEERPQRSA